MQELNAVVLYVVIFEPSQFWLASVLLTGSSVCQAYCKKPMMRMLFFCKYGWSNCTISYDLQQLAWLNFS